MTIRDSDRPSAASPRGGAEPWSLWRRVAQAIFAVLCLVAVARTDATLPLGTTADRATRADASLDQGRKLLRPKAALTAERVWRAIDTGGSGSGQDAAVAVLPEREARPLSDDQIGFHSNDERGPARLTIRAGYARAPPPTVARSRLFA